MEAVTLYQPWSCDKCHERGTIEHLSTEDAAQILADAEEDHAFRSPGCDGRIRLSEERLSARA